MSPEKRLQRIMRRVDKSAEGGCWNWLGPKDPDGYGRVLWPEGRMLHRVVYILSGGHIPPGYEVDHLCRNRACVNPAHMEPVTRKENTMRGVSPQAVNARKTHCVHGHELSGDNVYTQGGRRRQCRQCNAAAARRYKEGRPA